MTRALRRTLRWTAAVCVTLALAAAPAAAGPPRKAKVTVFLLPAEGVAAKLSARVSHALVKAMHSNPNLQVKDPDKLLVQFSGEVPSRVISRAKANLKKGIFLIKGGDPAGAAVRLRAAIKGLEGALAFVKKSLLARAMMALGVAQAEAKDQRAAYATFLRLLTWRPAVRYDTQEFSARHLPTFARAQKAARRLPKGSAELSTTPPGAKAYVDGRFVGITPATAWGLASGSHYATYKMQGYIKASHRITVSGTEQRKFSQELKQSDKILLLQQSMDKIKHEAGAQKATAAMLDLRSFLFIDQVIFARVQQVAGEQIQVEGYLYDLRTKMRLNQATQTVPTRELKALSKLTRLLFVKVRYDGTLAAPVEAPPPPPQTRRPFYATWWFWTAVAVGTAAVVVPVVLVPQGDSCEDGSRCITIRN